ncbi:M-like protein [Deinococcus taklimakanensis]|uniref:M-like protein n=1 Tax=Deinococcus taklimakanensis TaxID=536443 RepID=A0ABW5P335_9DEIO
MTQNDDRNNTGSELKTEQEISNVDLQFMGQADAKRENRAEEKAEAKLADEFQERGLDAQDVASAGSMIASDPASTHMPADDTNEG